MRGTIHEVATIAPRSPTRVNRQAAVHHWLVLGSLALPVLLMIGACAFWPMIRQEADRREPWELAWSWLGDAVAAFWYLWFVAAWLAHGQPLRDRPLAGGERDRTWRWVALSMAVGMALDAASTGWIFYSEKSRYAAATVTMAEGRCVKRQAWAAADHFHLACRYTDQSGQTHELRVVAVDLRAEGPPSGYPPAVVSALRRGDVEFPVAVRYSPDRPSRAWIDGSGGIDENGYPWASLGVLLFQAIALAIVALATLPRLRACARQGVLPWWVGFIKIAPLASEALVVGLFGVLELALNR